MSDFMILVVKLIFCSGTLMIHCSGKRRPLDKLVTCSGVMVKSFSVRLITLPERVDSVPNR